MAFPSTGGIAGPVARLAELERLSTAAGGDIAEWTYGWLPPGCPAALLQLLAVALCRPKGDFPAALLHLARGAALVDAQLKSAGINPMVSKYCPSVHYVCVGVGGGCGKEGGRLFIPLIPVFFIIGLK